MMDLSRLSRLARKLYGLKIEKTFKKAKITVYILIEV